MSSDFFLFKFALAVF